MTREELPQWVLAREEDIDTLEQIVDLEAGAEALTSEEALTRLMRLEARVKTLCLRSAGAFQRRMMGFPLGVDAATRRLDARAATVLRRLESGESLIGRVEGFCTLPPRAERGADLLLRRVLDLGFASVEDMVRRQAGCGVAVTAHILEMYLGRRVWR